jgi:hypothetical protein
LPQQIDSLRTLVQTINVSGGVDPAAFNSLVTTANRIDAAVAALDPATLTALTSLAPTIGAIQAAQQNMAQALGQMIAAQTALAAQQQRIADYLGVEQSPQP